MHLRIQQSFDLLADTVGCAEVPRVAWFADKASKFWDDNLYLFPDESTFPRRPRDILCMERILPLPEKIRLALIDAYCNPVNVPKARADPASKDCLLRVLLGRKRYGSSRPGGSIFFSLRNYKLHIDQVQELGLDATGFATSMADALAVLHWHAKIDACDIEFVLGSTSVDRNAVRRMLPLKDAERLTPGTSTYERTTNTDQNYKSLNVSLWLLDFDSCQPITMDRSGVRQTVKAFLETDPFCPRPYAEDKYCQGLWEVFSQRYVETGSKITTGASRSLPALFIEGVMEELAYRDRSTKSDNKGSANQGSSRGYVNVRG
ncbi:zinc finger protein-domain-containing protein [Penicillium angulare]|uniref:zinc finger protein-domain-containing protein n=1 Tax=Penicillium angulare TaxID=116970 RepID=UPI00253FA974|nr:zinc finger protein-domain-containing protein [Penicillium angulare]KAJ5278695.1 zinc finger protein-domain-containing protein [Penicillium angulare]